MVGGFTGTMQQRGLEEGNWEEFWCRKKFGIEYLFIYIHLYANNITKDYIRRNKSANIK